MPINIELQDIFLFYFMFFYKIFHKFFLKVWLKKHTSLPLPSAIKKGDKNLSKEIKKGVRF